MKALRIPVVDNFPVNIVRQHLCQGGGQSDRYVTTSQ